MTEKIRFGVIGVGARGADHIKSSLTNISAVEIVGICDLYEDRVEDSAKAVEEKSGKRPAILTADYHDILNSDEVDAVLVSTAWETHIKIATDALRAGKATMMEVGCAYSEYELRELIRAYEETKTPFMFMENCCYGREENIVLNMVKEGLFGEIVHCEGGYCHDLRGEVSSGKEIRHYRLRNYLSRNCENYPTHELGPIARVLDINHGNRMVSLTSVASKSTGIAVYAKEKKDKDFATVQADVVTTTISCAKGQTITITLSTSLPRAYSRKFTVCGTKGMYAEDGNYVFIDGVHNEFEWNKRELWNNMKEYEEKYLPDFWREEDERKAKGQGGGHGGMDYIMWLDIIDCLKNGKPMPIDVYDAAAWLCISYLSEASVAAGGLPQYIPDFTNGRWILETDIG